MAGEEARKRELVQGFEKVTGGMAPNSSALWTESTSVGHFAEVAPVYSLLFLILFLILILILDSIGYPMAFDRP